MRYSLIISIFLLGACVAPTNHPPQKRPDFSVPPEQRSGVVTSQSISEVSTESKFKNKSKERLITPPNYYLTPDSEVPPKILPQKHVEENLTEPF